MVAHSRAPVRVDRLRALNVPTRVTVELNGRGVPAGIALKSEDDGGQWKTTEGDERRWMVETIGEVWRVDDEWWRRLISRRYFEVMLEGGRHMMLFEDLTTGEWFIQNI